MGNHASWLAVVVIAASACGGTSVTNVYDSSDAACAIVSADAASLTPDSAVAADANAPDAAPDVREAGVIPIGQPCTSDDDCVSSACDSVTLTCVASQCNDRRVDGAETDTDCGGPACPVCATGKGCKVDNDCSTFACDVFAHVCVANACEDHAKDYAETDIDCGGGTCPACALGRTCFAPSDCANNVCDALTRICISNQCADHRQDGNETDIDCGGGGCGACLVGQKCLSSFDCQSGHVCNASKICQ
jgi:hypothetical protein